LHPFPNKAKEREKKKEITGTHFQTKKKRENKIK
jgi:hypothetical protein